MIFICHAFSLSLGKYLIPLLLLIIPYFFKEKIRVTFSSRDLFAGIIVSLITLLPFAYFMKLAGRTFVMLPPGALIFQLCGVSFPEEVYFRGFLQERLGNSVVAVMTVSVLFSLMHLPRVIFYGDIYLVLTFFPSLVMGFLYMKTSNVIPPTIFHLAANAVLLSFRAMMR